MPDSEKKKNKRKTWLIAVGIYAVLALFIYIIVNAAAINSWVGKVVNVIFPIILGLAIAYLCNPLLRAFDLHLLKWVKPQKFRRVLSILCTYLIIVLVILVFLFLVIPEIAASVKQLQGKYDIYISQTVDSINRLIDNFVSSQGEQQNEYIKADDIKNAIQNFLFGTKDMISTIIDVVANYGMGIISGVKNLVLALVLSIYFLYSKERRCAQCNKFATAFLNENQHTQLQNLLHRFHTSFGGFIDGKILDSLIIGILTYIVLLIFNVPYAVLVSFIVGVTNIIPFFGPFIGAIPSAFIIFIESPPKALTFIVIILIIQQLDGNVIGPRILGSNIGISPFCVVVAITIMGSLFGITGMIIGVPVFAVIIDLVSEYLDKRLRAKEKSVALTDYYAAGENENLRGFDDNGSSAGTPSVKTKSNLSPAARLLALLRGKKARPKETEIHHNTNQTDAPSNEDSEAPGSDNN